MALDEEVGMATMLRVSVDVALTGKASKNGGDHLLETVSDIAMRVCEREKLQFVRARLFSLGEHAHPPEDEESSD